MGSSVFAFNVVFEKAFLRGLWESKQWDQERKGKRRERKAK